jgi:hypothetical protein
MPLSGGADFSGEVPVPAGKYIVANITPGGVLAERSDGELFRGIRHGFGPKQRLGSASRSGSHARNEERGRPGSRVRDHGAGEGRHADGQIDLSSKIHLFVP